MAERAIEITSLDQLVPNMAATAPAVTDDADKGYSVGNVWIDTTADVAYICVDSTPGAAVWNTAASTAVTPDATAAVKGKVQLAGDLGGTAALPTVPAGLKIAQRTFTETTGAGTYAATIIVPAGGVVLDVRFGNQALWTALTSAVLNVGDTEDADGYFAAVDLKTAPIADVGGAGGISCFLGDTGAGAYSKLTKRTAAGTTITATVVTVGATGAAGRSTLSVYYAVPTPVAATKA